MVERLAAYSWRLLVIAAAAIALLWLIGQLWVVFLPLVLALFLTRILNPPTVFLKTHGWRPALAAATVLLGFLIALLSVTGLIGLAVGHQVDQIKPTLTHAVDDIETWLVTDAPGNISRHDISQARRDAGTSIGKWIRTSGGTLVSGFVVAFELFIALFLSLIITFFALKDGSRMAKTAQRLLPERHREAAERLSTRAWATLGGYLRGAALLGVVEGVIMGITLTLVGAKLAVPVAAITFLLAFIPFAGAIVAGAVAILVALATSGGGGALIVLVVAVLVQQFDNDLLAPFIYGKALDLHPVVVLLAIASGGALFGIAGTFLAVPVTAVALNMLAESRLLGAERLAASAAPENPE